MKNKFTNYAIKNYRFTLVIVLMIAALGITNILNMPRSEDPSINAPSYSVSVVYPGTSPKDMEQLVVKPLEKKIYAMESIKRITTNISNSLAVLVVEFDYNSNVNDKLQELSRTVNNIKRDLPEGIQSLQVQGFDPSNVNILQMELVSDNAPKDKLRKYATDLQDELEKVGGLKDVEIQGLPDAIVRVDLDLGKMAHLKIPLNAVANAVKSNFTTIPGGVVNENGKAFNVKTNTDFHSLQQIKDMIIAGTKNGNLQLKDIAHVYFSFDTPKHIIRLNGNRSVSVVAAMKKGQNISEIQTNYLPVIQKFKETLPDDIRLVVPFDQANNVSNRLSELGEDFLIAIFLVLLTLLPLGNRASLVVMLAIPLSLSIGIILLNLFGFNLNQLSIVGFVVALGLLVDDSIVVVENIERWMREGHTRLAATKKATGQITKAVLGCTATLMIAFMPLLFMPEEAGDFIRSLPVAIISTIFGSMLVALTIVPFFSSKLLKPQENEHGNIFLQYLQRGIHKTYAPLLDKGLKHPGKTLVIAGLIFAGALFLIRVIGTSLFPPSEKPQFLIDVHAPLQSNIHYTDSIMHKIERQLGEIPSVKYYTSNVGKGNPQVYYNVLQENEHSDFGEIFVQLQPNVKTKEKKKIIDSLREKWTPFNGAKVEVKDFQQGNAIVSPIEIKLKGENLDTLRRLAGEVDQLLNETDGTIYVNNPVKNLKSDIQVKINHAKAKSLGIPSINISRTVRAAIAGLPVGTFTDPEKEDKDFTILLKTAHSSYPDLNVFNSIYVNNMDGAAYPIKQFATLQLKNSPVRIKHLNKVRTVSVTSFVKQGFSVDKVTQRVIDKMQKVQLPAGYHFEMGGQLQGREESFQGFTKIILVAGFLFIAVLLLQFGTFKSTFIVLSVIPLGIVGAVLALLITGNTLSFVATIGLVALAGIEVKNTILQVDFTNELREQGMPLIEAIEKAGEARFLPIILTTMTAIGGLIPIALSSNPLISPLAIVMIGGLISSTLLSRIVTPVMYKLIPPKLKQEEEDD